MKKSLIALAVLAASGAAMAQSSVTIYGVADVWVGSSKQKSTLGGVTAKQSSTLMGDGGVAGSRIGFRGTEDLGGGLKANFVIETGLDFDAPSTTALGDRDIYVGLSGSFGEVKLGQTYSAYDDLRGATDHSFDANFASTDAVFVPYNGNPNNTIRYNSPSFGGFSGAVSYSLGEDKNLNTPQSASDTFSLLVKYENGPLMVGFAHQSEEYGTNNQPGLITSLNAIETALGVLPANLTTAPDGSETKYNLLGASYDFGVAKLVGSYNTVKYTEIGWTGDLKAKEYQVGVEVPVTSALTVAGGYAQSKWKQTNVNFAKASGFTLAANYTLSKRTSVYAAFNQNKVKIDGVAGDLKDTLYAVGVTHRF